MAFPDSNTSDRRRFLVQSSSMAGGLALVLTNQSARANEPAASGPIPLPKRVLGKTGLQVTTMTLGTAPCGICKSIAPPEIAKIVNRAIDEGVNCIDTAPLYDDAEEGVGLALGRRRADVVLATKVWADTIADAEKSLSKSLALLKTDYLDILYFHCLGERDMKRARGDDGVFNWLLKQKLAGKTRFVGISGHSRVDRYVPFLETGEVDVLLAVINLADRHTYNFEEKVLPAARKHNVGIVAMKVFGGASRKQGSYNNPKAPPEMPLDQLETAVRYALGVPGVATANLGVHNVEQMLKNVTMVRQFRPLSADEQRAADELGRKLAGTWGAHFGPVV